MVSLPTDPLFPSVILISRVVVVVVVVVVVRQIFIAVPNSDQPMCLHLSFTLQKIRHYKIFPCVFRMNYNFDSI